MGLDPWDPYHFEIALIRYRRSICNDDTIPLMRLLPMDEAHYWFKGGEATVKLAKLAATREQADQILQENYNYGSRTEGLTWHIFFVA